jgi:general secretion pathway protein I
VARPGGGFTLIEVLVALTIVAVGMAAVLGALSSSADTISYLRDKTFAQWVGENQIATLRLSGQLTPAGNSDGDLDYAGRKWHWRQEVTATQIPGMMRIDVKVRPAEVKGDNDSGWFTTVTGIQGDAVGIPNGYLPDWGAQLLPGQAGFNVGNQTSRGAPGTIGSGTQSFGVQGGGATSTIGGPSTLGGSTPGSSSAGGASSLGGPSTLDPGQTPPPTPPQDPDTLLESPQ